MVKMSWLGYFQKILYAPKHTVIYKTTNTFQNYVTKNNNKCGNIQQINSRLILLYQKTVRLVVRYVYLNKITLW